MRQSLLLGALQSDPTTTQPAQSELPGQDFLVKADHLFMDLGQKRKLNKLEKRNRGLLKALAKSKNTNTELVAKISSLKGSSLNVEAGATIGAAQSVSTTGHQPSQGPQNGLSTLTVVVELEARMAAISGVSDHIWLTLQKAQEAAKHIVDIPETLMGLQNHMQTNVQNQEYVQTLEDHVKKLEARCRKSEAEILSTQQELTACKDDLFRFQPSEQIPESALIAEFETMCKNVGDWIEQEISIVEAANPRSKTATILSSDMSFVEGRFLHKYPKAAVSLIKNIIYEHMVRYVFGKEKLLIGLGVETTACLLQAQAFMGEASKDARSVDLWRSETLTALAATDNTKRTKSQILTELGTRIFNDLTQVYPFLFQGEQSKNRFMNQVIYPVGEFATKIQTCESIYFVSFRCGIHQEGSSVSIEKLSSMILVDLDTERVITSDRVYVGKEGEPIGKTLLQLEPGFQRIRSDGGVVTLRPRVYLTKLQKPLLKRPRSVSTSQADFMRAGL